MYGHPFGPRLLQVEDARTYHHAGALPFSGEKRSGRAGTCCLRVTGWAVGSACRSRGLGRLVAGLLRLLHVLREIDVLGLRPPHRPDDDQDGAYDQEGERSVLEGHDLFESRLIVGVERREDDRQAVAEPETRGPHAGVEALVYVGGLKAPGPDDQAYDRGGQEDDQEQVLRGGAYEQVVQEGAQDRHDDACGYQERPASRPLADHARRDVGSGEHDVGDDQRDRKVRAGETDRVAEQTRQNGRGRIQRQPEAAHHHEDLQEVPQVLAAEQVLEGRFGASGLLPELRLVHRTGEVDHEGESDGGSDEERDPPAPLHVGGVETSGGHQEEQEHGYQGDGRVGQRIAGHDRRSVEAPLLSRAVFHRQRARRGVLAAEEDAVDEAQKYEDYDHCYAPLRVARQEGHQ